jgi:hypothetical protein
LGIGPDCCAGNGAGGTAGNGAGGTEDEFTADALSNVADDSLVWQNTTEPFCAHGEFQIFGSIDLWSDPGAVYARFDSAYFNDGSGWQLIDDIPPHRHPKEEHVTVISGAFGLGTGEAFDRESAPLLEPGSFVRIPVGMAHFAWTDRETVVQLNSIGPFGIEYVNPKDDPRTN